MKSALTPKQAAFVREYLVDLNGAQAAIRAGYSAKTAREIAAENLAKPRIRVEIDTLLKARAQRTEIEAERVLIELARIAFCDVGQAFDAEGRLKALTDMPEDVRRAISGLEVEEIFEREGRQKVRVGQLRKVKFWNKPDTLRALGEHLKLFTPTGAGPHVTVNAEGPVVIYGFDPSGFPKPSLPDENT